jgi:hypothetical protein
LIYHVIAFMKDEGNHLKTMVITLIVNLWNIFQFMKVLVLGIWC